MKHAVLALFLLTTAALHAEEPLRNEDVLRLLKAGVPASVIVAKITTSTTHFDVTSDALITLTTAGVPEPVLTAMVAASKPTPEASTGSASPKASHRPDLLVWKQECARLAWPDAFCRPGDAFFVFSEVAFYAPGHRLLDSWGSLYVNRDEMTGYTTRGSQILTLPWEVVTGFCTEFATRRMFYFNVAAPERQVKIEVAGPKARAEFLQHLIASTIPEIPDCAD